MVFRTLPSFLPAGVGASVGCSALRPAAACALFVPSWLAQGCVPLLRPFALLLAL